MGASLCCVTKDDQPSDISKLPVELLENVLFFLNYQQISQLRLVNRTWNSICSKYLSAAFSNIKTDVESFIRLTSAEDYIKEDANQRLDQVLKSYNRKDKSFVPNPRYKLLVQKVIFVNDKIKILIILRDGIFRNMFYKNAKHIFAFGNMIDWCDEEITFETNLNDIATSCKSLKLPPRFTKQLDEMVAFYEKKTNKEKYKLYTEVNLNSGSSYEHRKRVITSIAELLFYAALGGHLTAVHGNPRPILLRFNELDIEAMCTDDARIFLRLIVIPQFGFNVEMFFKGVCKGNYFGGSFANGIGEYGICSNSCCNSRILYG